MRTKLSKLTKGFTIIEVLIVLAIAGLIMLIVFLAVPALQRNSRNTRQKSDVASLSAAVTEYTSNNNGALPTATDATEVEAYWNPGFYAKTDPTLVTGGVAQPALTATGTIKIVTGHKCVGGGSDGGPTRGFVILYASEKADGTGQGQCLAS